jgi:hypothetical protein
LGSLGIDGSIILKYIREVRGLNLTRYGEGTSFYGSDDEPSVSIKCREFLE